MSIEHSPARQDGVVQTSGGLLDEYLTEAECADELDVCPRTLERWRRLREAPPHVVLGRRILYRRETVREWIRSRERDTAA